MNIIKYLFEIKRPDLQDLEKIPGYKLNLGCGYDKLDGFVNIDKSKLVNPDWVIDIEKGLPFKDNTFTCIYSEHCLEHIKPDSWEFVLNEIVRVAKDGCILNLSVPFDNPMQRTHIDHYRVFYWYSFTQYEDIGNGLRDYYTTWKLKRLHNDPSYFKKLFYDIFPNLTGNINFKYEIKK